MVYPIIRRSDGVLCSYAYYEDNVKPFWKEHMRKEDEKNIK